MKRCAGVATPATMRVALSTLLAWAEEAEEVKVEAEEAEGVEETAAEKEEDNEEEEEEASGEGRREGSMDETDDASGQSDPVPPRDDSTWESAPPPTAPPPATPPRASPRGLRVKEAAADEVADEDEQGGQSSQCGGAFVVSATLLQPAPPLAQPPPLCSYRHSAATAALQPPPLCSSLLTFARSNPVPLSQRAVARELEALQSPHDCSSARLLVGGTAAGDFEGLVRTPSTPTHT